MAAATEKHTRIPKRAWEDLKAILEANRDLIRSFPERNKKKKSEKAQENTELKLSEELREALAKAGRRPFLVYEGKVTEYFTRRDMNIINEDHAKSWGNPDLDKAVWIIRAKRQSQKEKAD